MPVLVGEGLRKAFAGRTVLAGVSLILKEGDAVLVRGRSGSGKSTLIHILAGVEVPDAGRVLLAGKDLAGLDPGERAALRLDHVGLVFQHFNLIPDLTAEENVRLPLHLARKSQGKERAASLLARVGLGDHLRAFPGTLSGGEMQRVAIARALANEPAVILADEPTANLDEENARVILGLLRDLAGEGRAVLVASHDGLAQEFFKVRTTLRQGSLGASSGGET